MKRVVSISLGTSKRNKRHQLDILGEPFLIERIGTDGDLAKFARTFAEFDGQVDALGIGGADLFVFAGEQRYTFRQIAALVAGVKRTPVVDGSGLKHTLERETVECLQRDGVVDFSKERVLLVSAVDRYGMAQALDRVCPHVVYGDLMFGIGLPIRIRSYAALQRLAKIVLPVVTRLPFKWFYPTGEKQERRIPKFGWAFDEATLIAGDSLYIVRYAPDRLPDKTILTQSVRRANLEFFSRAGARRVITTTPVMGGETFATNVMEGVLVALIGRPIAEIGADDYLAKLAELGWKPNVIDLNAVPV